MSDRVLGYCPDCGRPLRKLTSHGSAAIQMQFPELRKSKACELRSETFETEKNSKLLEDTIIEASKQLIVGKVAKKLSKIFDEKFETVAEELIEQAMREKNVEGKDFWKRKVSTDNNDEFQFFNELFAA